MMTAKFYILANINQEPFICEEFCVANIFSVDEWYGCNQLKRAQSMEIRIYQNSRYLCQISNDFTVFKKNYVTSIYQINSNVVSHIVLK